MIKRYNQFVKNKVNEDYTPEVEAPARTLPSLRRPSTVPSVTEPVTEPMEEEEVSSDKYEAALKKLADLSGAEYNDEDKSVTINGKRVIFPAETEKYHVSGVKKPFTTAEEVVNYFGGSVEGGSTHTPQLPKPKAEVRDEMTNIKDEEVLDSGEQFESKSYKSKRRIKK